jgi:hypothetical protein
MSLSPRDRKILLVLMPLVLLAGYWFMVLAPKRADLSVVDGQITQAETQRDAAVASAQAADQAKSRYLRDYETVARLGKAVPADDDVASLVYQLETIARRNKIDFRSVKLTATSAPAAAAAPANAAVAGAADKGDEKDASAPATAAPVVVQPLPGTEVGAAGLLTVPFTFSFEGDYMKLQRLLKAINGLARNEKQRITVNGRLLTVDGFSLAAGDVGFPQLKATVSATAYVVPQTDAATTAVATPQAPAGAAPTQTAMTQGAGR